MISVSEWLPAYGDPHLLEDEQGYARVWEHPRLQSVQAAPGPRPQLAFVDGVRRGEAWLYLRGGTTALAGVLAVGAAVPGGGYAGVRVERLFLRAEELSLPAQPGGWKWRNVSIPSDLNGEVALQRAMQAAEAELGAELAAQGLTVVLDGPMQVASPRTLGYVKTQQRLLLEPDQAEGLRELQPGQRSSLFSWGDKHGCYLRLSPLRGHQHPYFGLVRLETMGDSESALLWLHEAAGWLPAFAGVAHLDPRAPQNLQPIAGLERELRRRCGDAGLALRAVRQAVNHLQKEAPAWSESA